MRGFFLPLILLLIDRCHESEARMPSARTRLGKGDAVAARLGASLRMSARGSGGMDGPVFARSALHVLFPYVTKHFAQHDQDRPIWCVV